MRGMPVFSPHSCGMHCYLLPVVTCMQIMVMSSLWLQGKIQPFSPSCMLVAAWKPDWCGLDSIGANLSPLSCCGLCESGTCRCELET